MASRQALAREVERWSALFQGFNHEAKEAGDLYHYAQVLAERLEE